VDRRGAANVADVHVEPPAVAHACSSACSPMARNGMPWPLALNSSSDSAATARPHR
jgi:hypothetical protein